MSGRPRLALVGAGMMGANHARVMAASGRCELVSVVEPDADRGLAVADATGAVWAAELELAGLDAVVLAAPTEQHLALAEHVLRGGLPLLVEKPVCASLRDTEHVVELSRTLDVPLQCGLLERFNPAVMTALQMIREPLWARAERHSPYAPRIQTGAAWDLLVHDVDLVVQLFRGEEPVQVAGALGHFHPSSDPAAEDVAEALLHFTAGRAATISASRVGQRKIRSLVVHELERVVEVDLLRRTVTAYRQTTVELTEGGGFRQQTIMEVPEVVGREPLATQLDHFLDLVAGEVDAGVERDSILPVHRVIERIVAAGREQDAAAGS
jgi:predicted dehydrogenase